MALKHGSDAAEGAQRRAAVRLSIQSLRCEVWTCTPTETRRSGGQVINVSEGGLLVQVGEPIELGTLVYCRLALPNGPVCDNPAEVMRVEQGRRPQGTRLGLRFVGMPESRRDQLVRWIFATLGRRRRA